MHWSDNIGQLCTRLGLKEDAVWAAVEADTCYIVRVLRSLLAGTHGHTAITDLAKDAALAESFVSLVNKVSIRRLEYPRTSVIW